MPLTYQLEDQLVRFVAVGDVEFQEGLATLREGIDSHRDSKGLPIRLLFDVRLSQENREAAELRAIAETVQQLAERGVLAIVVAEPLYFGLARMFAAYLGSEGFACQIFHDIHEAEAWLIETES